MTLGFLELNSGLHVCINFSLGVGRELFDGSQLLLIFVGVEFFVHVLVGVLQELHRICLLNHRVFVVMNRSWNPVLEVSEILVSVANRSLIDRIFVFGGVVQLGGVGAREGVKDVEVDGLLEVFLGDDVLVGQNDIQIFHGV